MLSTKPEYCCTCPLYKADGPVWGYGSETAKIMLLGQNPGAEEVDANPPRAFVGGSGRVLSRQCMQAGIDRRSETYETNCVKCRTPNNRAPTDDEIRHCAPFLARELATVRPNIVILLGGVALYAATGRNSITNQRGVPLSIQLPDREQKALATIHPAHIMRAQELWPVAVHDLVRAKAQAAFPEIRRTPCIYHVDASLSEHGASLERAARSVGLLDFDLETTDLDPRTSSIICIGFAVDNTTAYNFRWTPEVARFFLSLAADSRVEIEGQNIEGFDIPFSEEKGIVFNGPTFDTMLGFHLTNSEQPKKLGHIMSLYTDMEYHKDQAKQNLFLYNAKDVLGQRRCAAQIRIELAELGMWSLYRDSVMPLQPVLRNMSRRGLRIDTLKAAKWSIGMDRTARQYEDKLRAVIGIDFNCHSPKQLFDVLYNKLGLPMQYVKDQKTKQMRPTANAEAIEKLAQISNDPVLALINKVRQLDHARVTYVEVARDENDFVHPRFGCAKAATGRLNSWDPNFQNVPVELRELYVPDTPDHLIICADWSQVETRIAMVLSGDETGLEILARNVDFLRGIAAEAYGVRLESVTDDLRYLAKFIWYGLAYGRGAKDIAKQTKRSTADIESFIGKLFTRFPRWAMWRRGLEDIVERDACLINPFGRRRWWYTRQVTEMYNFPIQSTCADMMYQAIIAAEQQLPRGADLRFSVHDDLGIVAHRSVAKLAHQCLRDVMEHRWPNIVAASLYPESVHKYFPHGWYAPTEAHIGNNWQECKKGNAALEQEILT